MSHKTVAPRYDGKVVHYFSDGSGNKLQYYFKSIIIYIHFRERWLHMEN